MTFGEDFWQRDEIVKHCLTERWVGGLLGVYFFRRRFREDIVFFALIVQVQKEKFFSLEFSRFSEIDEGEISHGYH